jgi:hypothetical protein
VGSSSKIDQLAPILEKRLEIVDPRPPVTVPEDFPLSVYLANLGVMLKEV